MGRGGRTGRQRKTIFFGLVGLHQMEVCGLEGGEEEEEEEVEEEEEEEEEDKQQVRKGMKERGGGKTRNK